MDPTSATSLIACQREAGSGCPYCTADVRIGDAIVVCRACGTVHHRACWKSRERCGSYACAPARRAVEGTAEPVLAITAAELNRAVPLPARHAVLGSAFIPPVAHPKPGGTNRLAIASLATALAGIPLFGIVTGIVAIALGALALGAVRETRQKGIGLAAAGVLLGIVDVIGWVAGIALIYGNATGTADLRFVEGGPDAATVAEYPPEIGRAMRANVVIERRTGLVGLGLAMGSGVVLSLNGGEALIVTNRHVVDPRFPDDSTRADGLGKLDVQMLGQPAGSGRVVWLAPGGIDLALVRVPCVANPQVQAAAWRKGRPAKVGAHVFAIGNPHRLGWTHTQGVISQVRTLPIGGRNVRVVQTQASINPGNSGGGLYDSEGFLIGINTWTADKSVSEGLGFAISLDSLLDLAPPDLVP